MLSPCCCVKAVGTAPLCRPPRQKVISFAALLAGRHRTSRANERRAELARAMPSAAEIIENLRPLGGNLTESYSNLTAAGRNNNLGSGEALSEEVGTAPLCRPPRQKVILFATRMRTAQECRPYNRCRRSPTYPHPWEGSCACGAGGELNGAEQGGRLAPIG